MDDTPTGRPDPHTQQLIAMETKDLYDQEVFNEILERLENLGPDSQAIWGKMTVSQMLAHCAEVQDVNNGKALKGTPFIIKLVGPLFKNKLIEKKPYPKNMRTHPQYIMDSPEDFLKQRDRLIDSIRTMHALGRNDFKHPIFGKLTAAEKGWALYKHHDHHLKQFGV